jgi:hypothetical protein
MPPPFPVPRLGPWLLAAAVACFALAVFLLVFKVLAVLIVVGILAFMGFVLLGLGMTAWKAEAEARRRTGAGPPEGPEVVKDAEAKWKDGA